MNWQENFLSFVNVYFSQLFSGGPKKQRNILVPFYVAMVVEGGGALTVTFQSDHVLIQVK